ncbi:hypothetical protein [uncultured Oscillibacter sp.]|uniref:hypothetical protein n=1 Tax=uncultured Oscillibacter sp. TaxID=876091 RepID=UPI0025F9A312|nr:hypothetical protein [uncultured Oscillibacter sp.]
MKRLERKWARRCTVLAGVTVLCALLPWGAGLVGLTSPVFVLLGVSGTVLGLLALLVARLRHLGCPNCGKGVARPQWRPGRRYYCPCCGKPFVYDDEEEIE